MAASGALSPVVSRLPFFSPLVIAGVTVLISVIAVALFALINRVSAKPVRVFRIVSAGALVSETDVFSPGAVVGLYAKTKAAATAYALAARARGLDVRVVHPSGICGPYDYGHGHLTQLVQDFCTGRLAAGVDGGYDFVDVRDVAAGILACCERGRPGECYILSGRYCTVRDVLAMLHRITGRRRVRVMLPLWLARAAAPLSEQYYRLLRQPPLYTAYSLYTLSSGARFSHAKAARELGYTTRPFGTTLADTVAWLRRQGRI